MKARQQGNNPVILKSGSSDLRRQEKKLTELIKDNYDEGLKYNTIYGFCNSKCNTIKLLKMKDDKSVMLLKIKRELPYPWPEYNEKGQDEYTVKLTGNEKDQFLKQLGLFGEVL